MRTEPNIDYTAQPMTDKATGIPYYPATIVQSINGMTEETQVFMPGLKLPNEPEGEIGIWGFRRKKYLRDHQKSTFAIMRCENTLKQHLMDINKAAEEMYESLMQQLQAKHPAPPQGTMEWVGHMNGLRQTAEEVIYNGLIYAK